jgi:hypothetical protein
MGQCFIVKQRGNKMYVHLNESKEAKAFFKNSKFAIKKDKTHNVVTIVRDDGEELQLWAESDSSVAAGIPGIFVDEAEPVTEKMYGLNKSELLKKALALYVKGGAVDTGHCSYFLCINLDNLGLKHASYRTAEELKAWIETMIPGATYGEWLDEFHPELTKGPANRAFRQGRYDWITWMIWYWEQMEKTPVPLEIRYPQL